MSAKGTKAAGKPKSKPKSAHVFDRADCEWYVDPPSVSAALFSVENFTGAIYDPCAGMGNIVRMAVRQGYSARASDIAPRPAHYRGLHGVLREKPHDFLNDPFLPESDECSIVSNPPYGAGDQEDRLEERFIDRALLCARYKVAVVLRLQWIVPRIDWLRARGCVRIWVISPRPSMLPGANILAGETPGGGAVDYCWVVFIKGADLPISLGVAKRLAEFDKPTVWTWRHA